MPNLTQERISERDRNLAAFDSAVPKTSVIDRLRGGGVRSERLALEAEKFDYRKAMDAAEMARKAQVDAQRATDAEQRLGLAESRMTLAEKQAELATKQTDIAERAAQLKIDTELAKTNATERAITAGETYFKEAASLDPYAPDFQQKFTDLKRRTLAAADNEDVKKHTQYLIDQRKKADDYALTWAPQAPKAGKDTEAAGAQRRLAHLESLRMKEIPDENVKTYLDKEIMSVKEQLKGTSPALPSSANETDGSSAATSKPAPPEVGAVVGGYKFKGGDPADKSNWEK